MLKQAWPTLLKCSVLSSSSIAFSSPPPFPRLDSYQEELDFFRRCDTSGSPWSPASFSNAHDQAPLMEWHSPPWQPALAAGFEISKKQVQAPERILPGSLLWCLGSGPSNTCLLLAGSRLSRGTICSVFMCVIKDTSLVSLL